ncbi:MAG: tRNA (adenosine(37)-N6)-dimethylallyltransferase MiaA [Alphaproteobacteria bacterium CG_4_9_14_3_um_filter_47_13]|nr:MAG: tRNA (adenosine(37)-N6)-dimethylallyltransferase MiaA [Alphaproteobacteria bacterium CG_4_9_14_3_um_filter_47_13]
MNCPDDCLTPGLIHVVYGATASGKSAFALDLAVQKNGVIINADSMQVYDALHGLTAQPSREDQEQVPHCLYALLEPSAQCSAALWRRLAIDEITKAFSENRTPILVGGTGLYIKALIKGLAPVPDAPAEIRAKAIERQKNLGNEAFHAELAVVDPVMAARLNPNDTQRLIRAREVFDATGKSLAYWQSLPPESPPEGWKFQMHFVNPERKILYARCEARFDLMMETRIIEEVKALEALINAGLVPPDAAITNALGFKPLLAYLKDECCLEDAVSQAKQDTRRYAKRQLTWFRNQM